MKQLCRCEYGVIASFVGTGCTMGRWVLLLGRRSYAITHYHPSMELEFSQKILERSSNKLHKNPCSGTRVVQCGWTDGQTDITNLIIAFRDMPSRQKSFS